MELDDTQAFCRMRVFHDTPAVRLLGALCAAPWLWATRRVWMGPWEGPATRWVDAKAPPPRDRVAARTEMTKAGDCEISERKRPIAVFLSPFPRPVRGSSQQQSQDPFGRYIEWNPARRPGS